MLIVDPVIVEGGWMAFLPLRRDTLIIPDDSIPYEKDAKVMVKAYQKFWSAYHKDRSHGGATLIAAQRWIKEDDKGMERLYKSMGWIYAYTNAGYKLYYYPIPKVDSLIVYVRSKEKYCSLVMIADIRMFDEEGKVIEGAGHKTVKVVIREANKWTRGFIYFPKTLGENPSQHPIYGLRFSIWPAIGSTDSCATFEVGPIYLK